MNFEEERRKRRMTEYEYASIQQPYDRKGRVNETFVKVFGKEKLPVKKVR